jgi:hypothetical protein
MTEFPPEQADVVSRIGNLQEFYQGSAMFLADIATKMNQSTGDAGANTPLEIDGAQE